MIAPDLSRRGWLTVARVLERAARRAGDPDTLRLAARVRDALGHARKAHGLRLDAAVMEPPFGDAEKAGFD